MKKVIQILLIFIIVISSAFSQKWVEMMEKKDVNFYEIQKEFNNYWKDKKHDKGKGWKQFKRWEYFWEQRVFPTGEFPASDVTAREFLKYKKEKNNFNNLKVRSNWTPMGPFSWNTISYNPGIGRINCSAVHPDDPDIIYVGAPSGGFWKTTDGGLNWITTTDELPVLGVSSIAIDPYHPDTIYIASGDGDAGDTYSLGILKSTDGGDTWVETGLDWSNYNSRRISKILINPNNTEILIAATSYGIYKSINGGGDWDRVQTGNFKDMEFKPGDPSVIYVSGTYLYKSVNYGDSFSIITNGVPLTSEVNRLAIAVTPANPEIVYMVAGDDSTYGFYGFYKSKDNGEYFNLMADSPNLMGYALDGSDERGQSWYDLAIAVSPVDSNEVYVGGVNIWKTTDGGTSWNINSHWYYYTQSHPYVHADIHDLIFHGNILYSGTDGGIFRTNNYGNTWQDISAGLATTQFYRFGLDRNDENLIIGGTQDNGTNRYDGGVWTHVIGGDGMESIIDYNNSQIMYGSYYFGAIMRSMNGGSYFINIKNNITESGGWVTPFVMDPDDSQTLYAAFVNVWKTTNRGDNWTKISNFSGYPLQAIAVAESNPDHIYAASYLHIYRTVDGGGEWVEITSGLPSQYFTYIAVSNNDPMHLWVTFSGYSSGYKVYESTNGGDTWTNISQGLPNIPVNCITYQADNHGALYIGTDVGIYCRDSSLTEWEPFMEGLPNVIVRELEIHYTSQKLRAATYGRGIWQSPLKTITAIETGDFNTPKAYKLCKNSPNPFNPSTTIKYNLPVGSKTMISVYNTLGQKVRTLINGHQNTGFQSVIWNGKNDAGQELPGGIYIYRIKSGNFIQARKMLYLK